MRKYADVLINILLIFAVLFLIWVIMENQRMIHMDIAHNHYMYHFIQQAILGNIKTDHAYDTYTNYVNFFHKKGMILVYFNLLLIVVLLLKLSRFWAHRRSEQSPFQSLSSDEQKDGVLCFKGRMCRSHYLIVLIPTYILSLIAFIQFCRTPSSANLLKGFILLLAFAVTLIPLTIKRLHDSNHSGLDFRILILSWLLCMYVVSITSVYQYFQTFYSIYVLWTALPVFVLSLVMGIYFLYLQLRRGNKGSNRYGDEAVATDNRKALYTISAGYIVLYLILFLMI